MADVPLSNLKSKLFYDQRSAGWSTLVSSPHLGSKTRFLLLLDGFWFVDVEHPLCREDGSVVYSRCWFSLAQSFSGQSHAGLVTIFNCLRFETSQTWRARSPYLYPSGTGRSSYTPKHWVPVSSPPNTRRATLVLLIYPRHGSHRKRLFHYYVLSRFQGNASTELLPSSGCYAVVCLRSCYFAMDLHVTIFKELSSKHS
jgi:hypothetical protein